MSQRRALEGSDCALQDLLGNGIHMNVAVLILVGDFRQILPVIRKGTMTNETKARLKSSYLSRYVIILELETNMLVHLLGDVSAGQFVQQLLTVGGRKAPTDLASGLINSPDQFFTVIKLMEILKNIAFPNVQSYFDDHKRLCKRAFLTPKSNSVNAINLQIQNELPEKLHFTSRLIQLRM